MNINKASKEILSHVENINVIPVLVIHDEKHAKSIAQALVDGGLKILEVTLRTERALHVIEEMAKVEGAIVASGTVLNEAQLVDAKNAGAQFHVSPGATDALIEASVKHSAPLLPGAVTSSEIMRLNDYGYEFLKFFPAEANGGVKSLGSLSGPFQNIKFCPTGGVSLTNIKDYLSLGNVVCAGGSWIVNNDIVEQENWKLLTQRAVEANTI